MEILANDIKIDTTDQYALTVNKEIQDTSCFPLRSIR